MFVSRLYCGTHFVDMQTTIYTHYIRAEVVKTINELALFDKIQINIRFVVEDWEHDKHGGTTKQKLHEIKK